MFSHLSFSIFETLSVFAFTYFHSCLLNITHYFFLTRKEFQIYSNECITCDLVKKVPTLKNHTRDSETMLFWNQFYEII